MLRGQLMQRKPAIRGFDDKLWGFYPDSWRFRFGDHMDAPRYPAEGQSLVVGKLPMVRKARRLPLNPRQ
jgi:hypothetical protein